MFKLIIFDLEGVFIYSKKRQAAIVEQAFEENGLKLKFKLEPVYNIRSDPRYHTSQDFIKKLFEMNDTPYNNTLAEKILQSYKTFRKNPDYLFGLQYLINGSIELLENIKSKKIKLALLTNANPIQNKFLLKKFSIGKYFDLVLDDSCGLAEKPNPERVIFALEKFGIKPEDAMFVEDSVAGIEAGKKAGKKTCGVLTGNSDKGQLEEAKADYVIESVKEMGKIKGLMA